jgi:CHAP domain
MRSRLPNGVITASNAIDPTTVSDISRASVASLLAIATLGAFLGLPASGALALPPGYGKGAGYCAAHGSHPSPDSYDGVYACATPASWGTTPFDANGNESFQCVELSARFLWALYDIWAGPGTGVSDGADLVGVVHSQHPAIRVGFPAPGSVPVAGDVVSLGPGGAVDARFGHTAIVVSDDPQRGSFVILGQNFPVGHAAEQTLFVDFHGRHNGRALINGVWTAASWLELQHRPAPDRHLG